MCKISSENESQFNSYIKDCAFVNQYCVESRYPSENSLKVIDEEALECIRIASKICNETIEKIRR